MLFYNETTENVTVFRGKNMNQNHVRLFDLVKRLHHSIQCNTLTIERISVFWIYLDQKKYSFCNRTHQQETAFVTQSSFPHRNGEKSFAKVMKKAYLVRFHFRTKTNSIALWRYEDVLSDQHVSTARSKFGKYASMRWVNKMENWSVGTSEKGNVLYTYFGT